MGRDKESKGRQEPDWTERIDAIRRDKAGEAGREEAGMEMNWPEEIRQDMAG